MPTDPAEIERITADAYVPARLGGPGRPLSLMSRNKVLMLKMMELYETKISGENGFVVNGQILTCSCGQASRRQRREPTIRRYITTVGPYFLEKFEKLLEQRDPIRLSQRQGRGKTAPSLLTAALLTYVSEVEKRPQIFCDSCGNPVSGKFPYADERLQAPAYILMTDKNSPVVYVQFGHKNPEIKIERGYLHVHYQATEVAKVLGKIEHSKSFTNDELSKALAQINSSYKVKKVFGEGLVQLESADNEKKLYLISCPCKKPSFL